MAEPTYQDPSKGNTGNTEDDNKFNQMLKLLSVVNGMNGQTLLGFALGRFLKGAYKRWEDGREWKKQREMYTKNGWVHPDGTLYSDARRKSTHVALRSRKTARRSSGDLTSMTRSA